MPGVEPGAIVEYRWKQTEDDNRFRYVRLHFQRDLPVQKVTYYVKPLSSRFVANEQMFFLPFHCNPTKPALGSDGWNETTVLNVPALRSEPFSPADPNIEQWALLFYREGGMAAPEKYWNEEGKQAYKKLKDSLKVSDEIKSAAQEVGQAKSDDDKIDALTAVVRKAVRGLNDPGVTAAERKQYFDKLPKDRPRTSAEIIKSGLASSDEMNVVFAAVATQAGFEARPALLAHRLEVAFDPKITADRYFLDTTAVALKRGDSWKFVDVSVKQLPAGMLPWYEEDVFALIADPKEPKFARTPVSAPSASLDQHVAQLKLSEQGMLSGNVIDSYTGHRSEEYRADLRDRSAAQRQEWFRDRLTKMFPESDVTNFELLNMDDASKPLIVKYHLEAPQFAQVTGKRILFQPYVFRRAQAALFTASDRKNIVEFPYGWKEVDQVKIELPENYDLDNADRPSDLNLGKLGSYTVRMTVTKGKVRELYAEREFIFGKDGNLYIGAEGYPTLKKVFEEVRTRDTHSISIKAN